MSTTLSMEERTALCVLCGTTADDACHDLRTTRTTYQPASLRPHSIPSSFDSRFPSFLSSHNAELCIFSFSLSSRIKPHRIDSSASCVSLSASFATPYTPLSPVLAHLDYVIAMTDVQASSVDKGRSPSFIAVFHILLSRDLRLQLVMRFHWRQ